jgi:energy-coupling factor transporter ATP-binding protein EcfA2
MPPRIQPDTTSSDEPEGVEDIWQTGPTVGRRRQQFLFPCRMLAGTLTILEGRKGCGKSTLAAAMTAALTTGQALLGRRKGKPGHVLWLAGEVDYELEVEPRLLVAGADLDRVHPPRADEHGIRRRIILPFQYRALQQAIEHWKCVLCVIDPLSSLVPPEVDLRSDQAVHSVLDPLCHLAAATNCSILLTRNLTKDRGADRLDQGLGGAGVAGVARSLLQIDWPDIRFPVRILRVVRCNQAGVVPAMEYRVEAEEGQPVLTGWRTIPPADDDPDAEALDAGDRDVRADARLLLRRLVGDEWCCASAVMREAADALISERTLRQAKAELGIRSRRQGHHTPAYWEWGPPKGGWQ